MKVYITRRGQADFVVDAPTIADAIVSFWFASKETPKASYRIHSGRRRKTRVVSSAIAYWRLDEDMRSSLYNVLEENATERQFTNFCEHAVTAGSLLGK
jgi:hypothetical protein